MHVTVYVGCSLDGYIARPDGAVDFLDSAGDPTTDLGFAALLARVDVLVMGRNTFDFVMASGFDWGYGDLPVRVATTRELDIPVELAETVSTIAGSPESLTKQLEAEGFAAAYVDGGKLCADFFGAGLVDQVTLTFVPVTIGQGLRVFSDQAIDRTWNHHETISDPSGLVQVTWRLA